MSDLNMSTTGSKVDLFCAICNKKRYIRKNILCIWHKYTKKKLTKKVMQTIKLQKNTKNFFLRFLCNILSPAQNLYAFRAWFFIAI